MLQPGDMNLTYKRYVESPVMLTLEDDRVGGWTARRRRAVDARHLGRMGDPDATAVSHVGWGLNRRRWDALTMVDRRDTNGTELRAVPGTSSSPPAPTSSPAASRRATSTCR